MKYVCTIILALALSVSAYSADFSLSAGGGLTGFSHWKHPDVREEYANYEGFDTGIMKVPTEATTDAMSQGLFDTDEKVIGFGFHGFFDATYVEVSTALLFTWIEQTVHIPELPIMDLAGSETYNYMVTQLYFSAFGKYPFKVGTHWAIFPLVGATYSVALSEKDDKFYNSFKIVKAKGYDVPNLGELLDSLWIKLGVGADYNLVGKLFLRTELLYGIKLPNKYEKRMADYWEEDISGMTNGLTWSLAVGYKIKSF